MIFVLPLPPSTNHGYHTSKGRWYKDEKVITWENECLWILKKEKIRPIKGKVSVLIHYVFPDNRKRDIDGKIKFILDLLTKAGVYKDDNQVTKLIVSKQIETKVSKVQIIVT